MAGREPEPGREGRDAARSEPAATVKGGSQPVPIAEPSEVCLQWATLGRLAEDYRTWLADNGASRNVVKGYPRAVERFVAFIREQGGPDEELPVVPLAARYLEAVRTGTFEAPASDVILGRTALKRLAEFVAGRS